VELHALTATVTATWAHVGVQRRITTAFHMPVVDSRRTSTDADVTSRVKCKTHITGANPVVASNI
jgi:hypothetical protein